MRQTHYFLACMFVTSAAAFAAACAKAPSDGSADDDTSVEAKGGGTDSPGSTNGSPTSDTNEPNDGTCSLKRSKLSFETQVSKGGACDTCMQNNCCAQTTTCFIGNAECLALNDCVQACNAKKGDAGGGGGGGGNGMGGGMGNGMGGGADAGDAGTGCAQQCLDKHPTAVDTQKAFGECYEASCKTSCQ